LKRGPESNYFPEFSGGLTGGFEELENMAHAFLSEEFSRQERSHGVNKGAMQQARASFT
jgi:hypothetical protein